VAASSEPAGAAIVVAPTIAIARARAEEAPSAAHDPASPAPETLAARHAPLGGTLRIEPSAPPARAPERATPEPTEPGEHTALSADYLREARAAALEHVAQRPPAPLALAATEQGAWSEIPAAMGNALPAGGDTHRSVAPLLEHGPEPANGRPAASSGPTSARGFEPVPVVRAPLAESLSSALGPLAELGGTRNLLPPSSRPRPAPVRQRESGAGRWLLLAAVALVTVAVVSVGGRLWQRYRSQSARQHAVASSGASAMPATASAGGEAASASRALLANRPAPEPGAERVRVVSATAAVPAAAEAGASATPESQLAAAAGRHVLSGNYTEALPLYRQLERNWPENTAYGAMARLLEKKAGTRNDTRTITPAPAAPRK
jgi:hypothetical protein